MAERFGSRTMMFGAGGRSTNIERDEAADASRFFSRIAYAMLGLGAPVGVVIHPLALFVVFPIGVALIVMAAALDGGAGFFERLLRPFRVPAFVALIAGLAWASLSILWTPYPVSAAQHGLKLGLLIAATLLAVTAPRGNARATDLYLFPIGVVCGMATIAAMGLSHILTGAANETETREWRGRRRHPVVSRARGPDRARAQRLCAASPDPGPGLRLYRRLLAADRRPVRRLSRNVVRHLRHAADGARTGLGRRGLRHFLSH